MSSAEIFTLKLLDRKPQDLTLDRVAAYLKEFASLLGKDSQAKFSSVSEGSVLLRAHVDAQHVFTARKRIQLASSVDESSAGNVSLKAVEALMLVDGISRAEIFDGAMELLQVLTPANEEIFYTVEQAGEVEGELTGVVGADSTMHISIREHNGRIVKLVCKNLPLALEMSTHLRNGKLRLFVDGQWNRTDSGWRPDAQACFVSGFEEIGSSSVGDIFKDLRKIQGNGWSVEPDIDRAWRELRGIGTTGEVAA
jgi:hypothetical protein